MVVIPNGIDVEEIRRHKKRSRIGKILLYVGRLERYKGVQYLIEVLPKLSDDVMLQVVGKGPYKDSLLALIARMGVKERVQFFQDLPREELLQKYADADVFVLLSNHEAFGISVGEALCSRVPCIVANASALKDWIDGKNCFGIDFPIDLSKLSSMIKSVIGRSVETLNFLEWDQAVDMLLNAYESIMISHKTRE